MIQLDWPLKSQVFLPTTSRICKCSIRQKSVFFGHPVEISSRFLATDLSPVPVTWRAWTCPGALCRVTTLTSPSSPRLSSPTRDIAHTLICRLEVCTFTLLPSLVFYCTFMSWLTQGLIFSVSFRLRFSRLIKSYISIHYKYSLPKDIWPGDIFQIEPVLVTIFQVLSPGHLCQIQ